MSRLGAGIADPYLKHRKTALQFDRAALRAFLGAEPKLEPRVMTTVNMTAASESVQDAAIAAKLIRRRATSRRFRGAASR
jgi:hypothetical protein